MNIPQKLTIHDGAMAMDGGSISLMGKDQFGNIMEILLDWSLEAQTNGTTKLNLNKMPLEKRSREEETLLDVLKIPKFNPLRHRDGGPQCLTSESYLEKISKST